MNKNISGGYKKGLFRGKYREEFCQTAIDHLSKRRSLITLAAVLKVNKDSLLEWQKVHQDFKDAVEHGQQLGLNLHEKEAVDNLGNKSYNAILWMMISRRLYSYTEQRTVKVEGLDKCKTYEDEIRCIMQHVAEGKITPIEGSQLAQIVSVKAKTYEQVEAKKIIEEIQATIKKTKVKK